MIWTLISAIGAQDFENKVVREFFKPLAPEKVEGELSFDTRPPKDLPYTVVVGLNSNVPGLFLYRYMYRLNDTVNHGIIEIYGQRFSLGQTTYNPRNGELSSPGSPYGARDFDQNDGDFYSFTNNANEYLAGIFLDWPLTRFYIVVLFNITNKQYVRAVVLDTFGIDGTLDTCPIVGIYNGKLCILVTDRDKSRKAYRTRLFSIEDNRLEEVLDSRGRNIELYFEWDKGNWKEITVLEKNIPGNVRADVLEFRKVEDFQYPLH